MKAASFSLASADALPIGRTIDGRDVLAIGRCAVGMIILVREASSATELRWEDVEWFMLDEAFSEIVCETAHEALQ